MIDSILKVDLGIVKKVTFLTSEHVYYSVFLENYHQENEIAEGIPIFSFGYNTYTYEEGSRVVCLVKNSDYNKVFIIGQTYDPNIVRNIGAAKKGELNIDGSNSGIVGIGKGDSILAYAGSSNISLTNNKINFKIGNDAKVNFSLQEFGASLNNGNNFNIKNGTANFNVNSGFKVNSDNGDVYFQGGSLSFVEGPGQKPSLLIVNGVQRYVGSEYLGIFSTYSFEVGSSRIKGKTSAVDWNVLQGSYNITLGTGNFNLELNSSLSNISFNIGNLTYLAKFKLDQEAFDVQIGSFVPDKIKIGSGQFEILVGNTPLIQTNILAEESAFEVYTKGLLSNSDFIFKASSIEIKNKFSLGTMDYDSSIKLDFGVITLTPSSKTKGGKIKLDGEVEITGSLVVKGSDGVEATSGDVKAMTISLKNHVHASSIPGGPSPPK